MRGSISRGMPMPVSLTNSFRVSPDSVQSFTLPPGPFVRILIVMRTFGDMAKELNRTPVYLSGLQKRFALPTLDGAAYSNAYVAFLRGAINLRTFDISEETLRDLWHLEKKLLQLIHVGSTGPRTWFLDQLPEIPADLENFVLKPLYSFAGLGVVIAPTRADIDAIPAAKRSEYILQERMNFTPVVETPHGATKVELRIMYVWLNELLPVLTIVRMGRGMMMGVDQNKGMKWVGSSAALVSG